MPHLTHQDRCKIENLLNVHLSAKKIALMLGKNHSTISREILKHRYEDEENKKRKRNFCVKKDYCNINNICKCPPPSCPGRCCVCKIIACNKSCSNFAENHCRKLDQYPYVCNGCADLKTCRKRKFFYMANIAEKEYRTTLTESRNGINASPQEIQEYNAILNTGVRQGQSVHHVMAAHRDVFQKCEKTVYNDFNQSYFSLPRGDMPKMCMRKVRTTGSIRHKIDRQCRTGRTLEDFKSFITKFPNVAPVQMDSVIGSIGGKVLLTLQFESGLLLAHLRNTNNSQSVLDFFDEIEQQFGTDMFRKLFPVILTDNGSEFSNPSAIETSCLDGSRRTYVFFCDPNASWQKGEIENNHTNLRRILPKGTSFNNLIQQDINLIVSHLNSYMRKQYDDIPAITRFNLIYGKEFLDKLGIQLIDPDEIILDPKLLKGKI